jgi:hypothetical protein
MNSEKERLNKILSLARKARPAESVSFPDTPPPGFATRVAARWALGSGQTSAVDAWERISWWGSGLAVTVCLIAFSVHLWHEEPTGFDLLLDATESEQTF